MTELKTRRNQRSVARFLATIVDERKRQDCLTLLALMRQVTGAEPQMWGASLVGFGRYRYQYASGREGEWFLTGFSPRKQNLTLYIMAGFDDSDSLLSQLGKHTIGKACLYLKRLDDVHLPTLKKLIQRSVRHMTKTSR